MISGTSAGAFIAALFAMTRDIKAVDTIVRKQSNKNLELLLDLTLPVYSLFTGKVRDRRTRTWGNSNRTQTVRDRAHLYENSQRCP